MKTASGLICTFLVLLQTVPLLANPGREMAHAANQFLAALESTQREKALFPFNSDERKNWHFVPKQRNGLSFKEMTATQRDLSHALLKSGLGPSGYVKATTIITLEKVLFDLENQNPIRDPERYYISIFAEPGATNTWGWRVEGHHLSINFTVVKGLIFSSTPSFFGSNPGEVRGGPHQGLRPLANEEDLGRKLVTSLTAEQKKVAVISTKAPRDIITGNARKAKPLEEAGLSHADMTKDQRSVLMTLIGEYLERSRKEIAKADLQKLKKAGVSNIRFAWAGGFEPGEPHYYRIQGPTFLMEYDNTQNNANHIHAVWRDFENDFGEDVLRQHYEHSTHDK